MSLLSEVIKGVEKVDVEDINKRVPELKKTVEILKTEGLTYVDNIYLKYAHKSKRFQRQLLLKTGHETETELSSLQQKANFVSTKKLIKTDYDLSKNIEELSSIDFALNVLLNVLNLDKLLNIFEEELARKNYLTCARTLCEMDKNINGIPPDEKLEVILELQNTVKFKKIKLKNLIRNVITDFVEIQEIETKNLTVIKIRKDFSKIKDALEAAYFDNEDIYELRDIARRLWQLFFVPIVETTVSLDETEDENYVYLAITVKNVKENSNYKTVFSNLKKILEFLTQHFNNRITESITALEYIGNDIRDNLSELIIKSCLRATIPNDAEELQQYKAVIEDTKELEKSLFAAKIFTNDTESILEYVNKVDILFINKKCQKYLETATDIMKKDLHDMEEVGKPYDPFEEPEE